MRRLLSPFDPPFDPPSIPLRSGGFRFEPPLSNRPPLKGGLIGTGRGVRRDLAIGLAELARRVDRLRLSHRDPEAFHVEKSEIAAELRRLAGPSARRGCGSGEPPDFLR